MNRLLTTAALILAAAIAQAAPPTAITNYYTQAVIIRPTCTNAGTTGIVTGRTYVALAIAPMANAEYTAALMTNDVRPFISRTVDYLQERIAAQASSNRFTTFQVSERSATYSGATNRTLFRGISEQQTISITPSYAGQ
jgi:hypothetical protein